MPGSTAERLGDRATAVTQAFGSMRYTGRAMGSPVHATVVGVSAATADRAWTRITDDLARTDAVLSRFRAESDLSRLNRVAGDPAWQPSEPRLATFAAAAARAWRITDGRFDARVLRRLEELGERAGVPLPGLRHARPPGGEVTSGIERCPRERRLRVAEPLDSGGLGKGLGLRWAARAARGVLPAGAGLLIEAGGDVVMDGPQPNGGAWRIGIEDPAGEDEPLAVIERLCGAVATSSIAVRRWTAPDGRRVHHLIDPGTGEPGGPGLQAVTVALLDPGWAEIWSKALFLAGAQAIGPWARSRGLAAWWVRDDNTLEMTPAARASTIWERPRARRTA